MPRPYSFPHTVPFLLLAQFCFKLFRGPPLIHTPSFGSVCYARADFCPFFQRFGSSHAGLWLDNCLRWVESFFWLSPLFGSFPGSCGKYPIFAETFYFLFRVPNFTCACHSPLWGVDFSSHDSMLFPIVSPPLLPRVSLLFPSPL